MSSRTGAGTGGPPADPIEPYVYLSGQSELRWMGDTSTFLATGDRTGDAFALVDERAVQGETVPLHLHADDMKSFHVLEGEITFYLGDRPGVRPGVGSFVHVPGGTVHGFRVESESARYLILTTTRHGEFYRAITSPSTADGRPPPHGSIDAAQIRQACREFGVEFVGPLPET